MEKALFLRPRKGTFGKHNSADKPLFRLDGSWQFTLNTKQVWHKAMRRGEVRVELSLLISQSNRIAHNGNGQPV